MLEVVVKILFLLLVVTNCNCYRINFMRSCWVSRSFLSPSRLTLFCSPLGLNDDQKVEATFALDVHMNSDDSIKETLDTDPEDTILDQTNRDYEVPSAEEIEGAEGVEEIEEIEEIDLNPGAPKCYVIISNLQSGSNIGSICRNALAFNVHEVIVIGRKGFRDKMRNADRGAKRKQSFVHFNSILEAATYLKETKNCSIVGVEIMDSAVSLTSLPFTESTAFMFGNEGGGLSERQRAVCDKFTYIPQYARGGMASINVACASAVVLQTFAIWANYRETQRLGEKFV